LKYLLAIHAKLLSLRVHHERSISMQNSGLHRAFASGCAAHADFHDGPKIVLGRYGPLVASRCGVMQVYANFSDSLSAGSMGDVLLHLYTAPRRLSKKIHSPTEQRPDRKLIFC
jgi:hypothetical protein